MLQGAAAVELRAVDPATAADYLERVQLDPPPEGWHDLTNRLRASPASALAEALNNPLALTLIRDTYQAGDDARELLDYCDATQQRVSGAQAAEELTGHLMDRILPAAYAPRPGEPPPRYDLQTAQNALTKIAARMNQDGTRDCNGGASRHGLPSRRGSSPPGSGSGSRPGWRSGWWTSSRTHSGQGSQATSRPGSRPGS